MTKLGALLAFALFLTQQGCKESESKSERTHDAGSSPKALFLSVGICSDGAPFFDWDESLQYSQKANGLLTWDDGATLEGSFKRLPDGGEAVIDLRLNLEEDRYLVTGTYKASVPITLKFLGTTEDEEDAITKSFPVGDGSIQFEGEAPYTYEKQR